MMPDYRLLSWLVGWMIVTWIMPAARVVAVDYQTDVLPILREHCIDCHGPDLAEAGLRLDSMLMALKGGDSGEASVVPGASDNSYLIARITHDDPSKRMPPDSDRLSSPSIDTLRQWIDHASAWDQPGKELALQRVKHWAFEPLTRPVVPSMKPGGANPIDAFIRHRLRDAGLEPTEAADRRTLIRRLYLVMHGLPPTPDQVASFLSDEADDAWERMVDQVLSDASYGERWATHWLDVVRFGETTGFETNRERPNAWRYRDWVVQAWNSDKPYDQFIVQQIAGDAVGEDAATGFLVAGPNDIVKGQDKLLGLVQRQDELADIIHTTGTAFLGLTIGCARCHNHKFDPITQTDYYAMQAIFAGVHHGERALSPERDDRRSATAGQATADSKREPVNARLNVESFPTVQARFVRMTIDATNQGEPCIDELEIYVGDDNVALASRGVQTSSSGDFVHPLHRLAHLNDGRTGNEFSWIASESVGGWVQVEWSQPQPIDSIRWGRDRTGRYADRLATEYRFEASVDGMQWTLLCSSEDRQPLVTPRPNEQAMVYAGTFSQPGPTHRLYRGDPLAPREAVAPAAIRSLTPLGLDANAPEQLRRLELARWIADRDNPLTARVIVNRLWQAHFGTGLVDTPSDFGTSGALPTHPELLDFLAAELIDAGWSLKHIQRLILNSETWQQSSRPHPAGVAVDAASRLLWRFPPRRLDAEAIRDSVLAVSGKLDTRVGGAGFSGFEVEPENVRHYHPKQAYGPADWRRMIYMTKVRQERDSVFGVFDCPDFNQVVAKRTRSTTPLQALNLLNSRFMMQQADLLAARLASEADQAVDRIALAFHLCFGRDPLPDETDAALRLVADADWRSFARALLNANEFVWIP